MKKTQVKLGLLSGLLLVASAVNAQDYPAADFQPKVIFRDESVIDADTKTTQAPCVSQELASSNNVVEEIDPKYPASNFQPKVIFSEAN